MSHTAAAVVPARLGRAVLPPLLLAVAIGGVMRAALVASSTHAAQPLAPAGARDPAWSPDGRHVAVTLLDRVFVIAPDGRGGRPLVTWDDVMPIEREPAWSPEGDLVAFAADHGQGFDIYVVASTGGAPRRVTFLAGDERRPTWTGDGRLVFAHRGGASSWDLLAVDADPERESPPGEPVRLTSDEADDTEPVVSPDGRRVLFVSDRRSEDGDRDLWALSIPARDEPPREPVRVVDARGPESRPSWSPDGRRLVFSAIREGVGSLWVARVPGEPDAEGDVERRRPAEAPVLVSRHGGAAAWSPDGRTLVVADVADDDPVYNGNPMRDAAEPPPMFAHGGAFGLRLLPAPREADDGARAMVPLIEPDSGWALAAFDRVWSTLRRLYYDSGPGAERWRSLQLAYRPQAARARDARALEDVIDAMVAEQPLVKAPVGATDTVVVSGHRLASESGVAALGLGGNVVDAAVAVSFALGVVEPEASGIGGDGMALVFLEGMAEPVVVDFKDQVPSRATLDNPAIFRNGRIVADGPAAANIPGVVAGLEWLHQRYGSGKVRWEDLVAPAIKLADEGFVLDAALPTSLEAGRAQLLKYPEAARIYLPGGRVPRAGDRFVNRDYAATLRAIAGGGATAFYRGPIARSIVDDMTASGGLITLDDLAQYRAIERAPLKGVYRGHTLFSAPPPVPSGVALLETLQILEGYRASRGVRLSTDPDYLHHVIEAWKVRDPDRRIADPAQWPVDVTRHLEPEHAAALFRTIDPARAGRFPRDPDDRDDDQDGPGQGARIGRGTTAFVVADTRGNMIAVTQTLSTWGGTFYVSKGLGFLYNNHLRSGRTERGAFGQLLPLARSATASAPTLVFRGTGASRTPWAAVGAAGNAWITTSVYTILLGLIDGQLPVQQAVEAPRLLVGRDPSHPFGTGARVQIEDRLPRSVVETLEARGHAVQKIGRKGELRYGYASAAVIDLEGRRVDGGSEPRRSHASVGWNGPLNPVIAGAPPGRR